MMSFNGRSSGSAAKNFRWLVGAAVIAGAGTCLAQSADAQETKRFNYDHRLGGGAAAPAGEGGAASTTMVHESSDDGHEYSLRIDNGQVVSVQVDGKEVPKNRLRQSDGKVEILDENGEVMHTLQTGSVAFPGGGLQWKIAPGSPPGGAHAGTAKGLSGMAGLTPPPVMLGITMSEPDEDVADHLGVKADEVIQIDTVVDGLPAARAGLKVHDVIVAIDGGKPVSQEKLREILRTKKPGDVVKLAIIRKGKTEDVKVALEAYSAEKLGQPATTFDLQQGDNNWWTLPPESLKGMFAEQWGLTKPKLEEVLKSLETALAEVKQDGDLTAEKMKSKVVAALTEAIEQLKEQGAAAQRRASVRGFAFTPTPAPAQGQSEGARPQVYLTPMPGSGGAEQTAQLERLNTALERMEKRLAELEERLDRRQRDAESHEERPKR